MNLFNRAGGKMYQHRRTGQITPGTVIFILMCLFSLEINPPYALDQLDDHQIMTRLPVLKSFVSPGDHNPLVIMNRQFTPLKLFIRSTTILILVIILLSDLFASRRDSWLKPACLGIIILFHVLIPSILMIIARLGTHNDALAHDGGVIQIEESMKMLMRGVNPYAADFTGTPLENWRGFKNNIIYHVPYMPGAFLYPLPFYLIWNAVFGWYDQRIPHLLLFLGSMFLIGSIFKNPDNRLSVLSVFCLSPFFVRYFILGTNDIVCFFLILAAIAAFIPGKIKTGFIAVALACGIKQLTWFFVPFFLLFVLKTGNRHQDTFQSKIRRILADTWPGILVFSLTVLPFLVLEPVSFYRDTFLYGAGGLPTSYPIQGFHGYGFATFLLFFKLVPDGNADFPFGLIQLLVLAPLLTVMLIRKSRNAQMSQCVMYSGIILTVFMFFSRYYHGNFAGFSLFWILLAFFLDHEESLKEE